MAEKKKYTSKVLTNKQTLTQTHVHRHEQLNSGVWASMAELSNKCVLNHLPGKIPQQVFSKPNDVNTDPQESGHTYTHTDIQSTANCFHYNKKKDEQLHESHGGN